MWLLNLPKFLQQQVSYSYNLPTPAHYQFFSPILNKGLVDYQSVSTVITLEPSELVLTRFCVDVNITQDSALENTESFLVVFSSPEPSITINNGAATVMILDDDCKYHIHYSIHPFLCVLAHLSITVQYAFICRYLPCHLWAIIKLLCHFMFHMFFCPCISCWGWVWPATKLCQWERWKLSSLCISEWSDWEKCLGWNCP